MLITGQMGVGATTLLESIIAQQILRGGGVLIMDPWCCLKPEVERYANFAGRNADYHVADLNMPLSAGESLGENRITYVPVPLMANSRAYVKAREFFDHFWLAAAKRIPYQGPLGTPFMVVVPDAGALMDVRWEIRYEHARAANLAVVAHANGVSALERAGENLAAIVLENSWTKVFFKQPSAHSLSAALDCIKATAPLPPTASPIREQLVSLGMGEMLVSRPEGLEEARCYMLKR